MLALDPIHLVVYAFANTQTKTYILNIFLSFYVICMYIEVILRKQHCSVIFTCMLLNVYRNFSYTDATSTTLV